MELGGLVGETSSPYVACNRAAGQAAFLAVETPKRVQETGERTGHLSVAGRGGWVPFFPCSFFHFWALCHGLQVNLQRNACGKKKKKNNFKNGFYILFLFYADWTILPAGYGLVLY